jgi:hypothetical protein
MIRRVVLVASLILVVVPCTLAERIYFQDFESGSDAGIYGSNTEGYYNIHLGATGVTSVNPYAGSYSFRGSISENGTLDNILHKAGAPNAYNQSGDGAYTYGGTDEFDIWASHTAMITFQWWHLIDSGELGNLGGDTHKIIYIYTQEADPSHSYIIIRVDDNGQICLLTYENGINQYQSCGAPETEIDMQGIDLDDGNWHQWMVHIEYGTGGNTGDWCR